MPRHCHDDSTYVDGKDKGECVVITQFDDSTTFIATAGAVAEDLVARAL